MNPELPARANIRIGQTWLAAACALALAVGAGVLLTQLMMAPPGAELRDLAVYLTLAGAVTLAAGWLAIGIVERAGARSLRAKVAAGALIGTAMALVNVLIVAELMFISTSHDLRLLSALVAFAGVITVAFSLWAASIVTARIEDAAAAIRSLANGRYDARLPDAGGDEIARLAGDVNLLAERLSEAARQRRLLDSERRDLTVAISHDLRTPLASMRAMVEALDDGVVDVPDEVARYYTALRREIERLSSMIDDLFELARIDAGALQLDRQPIAVQEIAAEVVDAMQARALRDEISLTFEAADGPVVPVDAARLERALANLVQNAFDHTSPGGAITVSVAAAGDAVELRVTDTGHGISREDLPHIWDRFYRSDKARGRNGNGDRAGLGLAIVRGIVEAHGGSVDVLSTPGVGTSFALRLPRD